MSAKKLSKKTIALLRKVAVAITEEPRRLDMDDWIQTFSPFDYDLKNDKDVPPCGTQACIAGWSKVLADKNIKANAEGILNIPDGYYLDVEEYAADVLGLTSGQAGRLFFFKNWEAAHENGTALGWPSKFSRRYNQATQAKTKAKITVERIEHFIATNGAE